MIVKTPAKKHKTGHYRINFLFVLNENYNHNNIKTQKNKLKRQNQTSNYKNQNEKKIAQTPFAELAPLFRTCPFGQQQSKH